MEKKCEGVCPICGSENVNWHDSELQGYFIALARKFHLVREFKENGIL